MPRPAVFLDRDGTIVREADYLREVSQLRLLPGAAQAIRELNQAGLVVVVLTNQSGLARGLFTEADYQTIHAAFLARLARYGAHIDAAYYCPHHPEATVAAYRRRCDCRKPGDGLFRRAARELDLDPARSYAVGDRARDLIPGRKAGARTLLVRTGYGAAEEAEWRETWRPDQVVADLRGAVQWMLAREVRPLVPGPEAPRSRATADPCEQL